jgi:hypothetical protein
MDKAIEKANAGLKSLGVRLTLQQLNRKLYLRGVFPPKPESGRSKPYTQRYATGFEATKWGIKEAVKVAQDINDRLERKTFKWQPKKRLSSTQEAIAAVQKNYFIQYSRTPETINSWKKNYQSVYNKIVNLDLTVENMMRIIAASEPNGATRRRTCTALRALAKVAEIELDLTGLQGNYGVRSVDPRIIPSDAEIEEVWAKIENPQYQLVYGLMATYGIRNHEALLCDRSLVKEKGILIVREGKTGERKVWPIHERWVEQWRLWDDETPKPRKSHPGCGDKVRKGLIDHVPFGLYNLRHAWSLRAAVLGLSNEVAAKMLGHSVKVHNESYLAFWNDDHLQQAWERMKKPPG